MESVREKVAYLRGLIDSQRAELETAGSVRLWEALVDALNHVGEELDDLRDSLEDQEVYLSAVDEDLMDLEDTVYGIDEVDAEAGENDEDEVAEEGEDGEEGDAVAEGATGTAGTVVAVGAGRPEEDAKGNGQAADHHPTFVAVECPNCHARLFVEEELFDEPNVQVTCPECDEPVYTGEAYHEIGRTAARDGRVRV